MGKILTALGELSHEDKPQVGLVVDEIASYIDGFRNKVVPAAARDAAFRCILDLLAASGAGVNEHSARAVRGMALGTMSAGSIPIWFTGSRASVAGAAWANSAAASALDLDDGNRIARGHPGAAVIPTALAVGEETGASVDKIISAIVIGYQVGVSIAAGRTTYGNTGTWASYAVVATAAALRNTPQDVIAHALAIAGESAPNQLFASAPAPRIPVPEGSAVKEGIPWAVVTGLVALGLAESGHTGPRNILDSPRHYNFPDDQAIGESLHICNTYFKLYSCCRHIHAPLDAILDLRQQHQLEPQNIDSIAVETTSGGLRISNRTQPSNLIDVQYSIPYCVALSIVLGEQALLPLTSGALNDARVEALAAKVTLSLNEDFDALFPAQTLARVTVTCGDSQYVSAVMSPRGEATNPLSWEELEAKFRVATRIAATESQQTELLAAIRTAKSQGMGQLMDCLSHNVFTHEK